jgi:hypothetical protein
VQTLCPQDHGGPSANDNFANDAQAGQRIEAVVDDHLRRFAWREEITIDWQRDL